LVRYGILPQRSEPEVLRGPLRVFATSLRTCYTPANIYPGPLRLILADDPRLEETDNRRKQECLIERWKQWAPGLISVHASGNHLTTLRTPHVDALALILRDPGGFSGRNFTDTVDVSNAFRRRQ